MAIIKDKDFIRGKCPMTKEDIRILTIAKMDIQEDSKIIDIGSGTGTITVQSAIEASKGMVYSIERDEDAYDTTIKNIDKFNCTNVEITKGEAIEVLDSYIEKGIKVDSIFIGGSGGSLEKIIDRCDALLKEDGALVMNFITLDNCYKAMEYVKRYSYLTNVSLVNISNNREGTYMMISNNPIYIVKCSKGDV